MKGLFLSYKEESNINIGVFFTFQKEEELILQTARICFML